MIDLTRHPRLLRLLSYAERAGALFRRKDQKSPQAGRQLAEFYLRGGKEPSDQLVAASTDLGNDVQEIRLAGRSTRVWQNCSAIDDLAAHVIVRTKPVMYRLLAAAGLPVPDHLEFWLTD